MKRISVLTILLITILSCGEKDNQAIEDNNPVKVVLSTNDSEGLSNGFVTASGKIESENSANLSTRMMGYITNIPVKVGQNVVAGQLLVKINNTDLEAKKAQVEASILQATSAFNNAKKDYERFKELFAQQSASQKEFDDMTSRFEMAKANLEGAK